MDPLSAALNLGTSVINKIWPDPAKQAEEQRKLQEIFQRGELAELNAQVQLLTGQLTINMEEAKHPSVLVAGWRPFVGWVGGLSLAYAGILEPMLRFGFKVGGYSGEFPAIDTTMAMTILMGMLGMGAMRSFDKKGGKDTGRISK